MNVSFEDLRLIHAIAHNNIEGAKQAVDSGANVNLKGVVNPLIGAIMQGNKDIVSLLITKDADINAIDHTGMTPLYVAAIYGNEDIVRLLIDKGANINTKKEDNGWTPLHTAALNGQKKVAELLISYGAGINTKDNDGWTPLHFAAKTGHENLTKLLLESGADKSIKNYFGKKATDKAYDQKIEKMINDHK